MAKEVTTKIKLQASGGQATPAPPIGPALGQHGVNIGQFVSQFNERTKELNGRAKLTNLLCRLYKWCKVAPDIKKPEKFM